jgi:hypothetical protein
MAPKPEPAGLASAFGTLTSVFVAAILVIMTWTDRHLAAPSPPTEAIYHPQLLLLY